MAYLVGVCLALAVSIFATFVGLDRGRVFYSTLLIIVASYYGLFAVMGGSLQALIIESAVIFIFVLAAVLGFKMSMWMIVAGLFAHGIFDFFHHRVIVNPGVPAWWPMFCLTYDCTAGLYLAWLLRRAKSRTGFRRG